MEDEDSARKNECACNIGFVWRRRESYKNRGNGEIDSRSCGKKS